MSEPIQRVVDTPTWMQGHTMPVSAESPTLTEPRTAAPRHAGDATQVKLAVWGCPLEVQQVLADWWASLGFSAEFRRGKLAELPTVRLPTWVDGALEARLLTALPPLRYAREEGVRADEIAFQFPKVGKGRAWSALLTADSSAALAAVEPWFALLGISVGGRRLEDVQGGVRFCLEDDAVRDEALVKWLARRVGGSALSVQLSSTPGREACALWVASAHLGISPTVADLRLRVETDDPEAAAPILDALARQGLAHVQVAPLQRGKNAGTGFALHAEPYLPKALPGEWEGWSASIRTGLQALGIDLTAFPLQTTTETSVKQGRTPNPALSHELRLVLPIDAVKHGVIKPYAGPFPQRFELTICHQRGNEAVAEAVSEAVREAGFRVANVEPAGRRPRSSAFQLHAGALQTESSVHDMLILAVERAWQQEQRTLLEEGATLPPLPTWRSAASGFESLVHAETSESCTLILPMLQTSAVEPLQELADFNLAVLSNDPGKAREIADQLRKALPNCRVRTRGLHRHLDNDLVINYGGCPPEPLQALCQWLQSAGFGEAQLNKEWGDDDMDVHIVVPVSVASDAPSAPDPFGDWGRPQGGGEGFLAVQEDSVRFGRVVLPRRAGPRHPLAPSLQQFDAMALDAGTRQVLQHVAEAVAARAPCLLEGPTAATKTSGILFAAALLGQPVLRINLSAQTDASELIGQFQPQPGGGFAWMAGAALRAVQEGFWLVLDEVNLAPPQILERLNSLLELPPSLTVAERDLSCWGAGGQPIANDFRIFGTMNPAEYAGRSAQSAAGKDRWLYQLQVHAPDADAVRAMLTQAAFGRQPKAAEWGSALLGSWQPAVHSPLPDTPLVHNLLERLAQLQVSLTAAAGSDGGLGADRREPYVFTRRGLLGLVALVSERVRAGEDVEAAFRAGLRLAFVDRVAPQHRAALALLMDAAGLGPTCWLREAPQVPRPSDASMFDDLDDGIPF